MSAIIEKLTTIGQSLWMDNIQRKLLENGQIRSLIEKGEIRGMTSNPTIFNNAISKTKDYDPALVPLAWAGWDTEKIFWELVIEDIKGACDLFAPLYEETNGGDGYVSIEVTPNLAHDSEGTGRQAQQLWARVARPNLMVKIPATEEGIPAIRQATAAGINVNITLIFSLTRYAEVMNAYLQGLEDRMAGGHPINHIASVASFFVSRVDSKVDELLPKDSPLRGEAAVANAKLAYEEFSKTFAGERWEKLKAKGARLQRPLWASTSTKNPAYPDTLYIDNLIGPHTVNTVPPATLDAVRDHAKAEVTITRDVDHAHKVIQQLETAGISMEKVTQELEDEGVKSFAEAITALFKTIEERRNNAVSSLGSLADPVAKRIAQLEENSVPSRFWAHDPTLWTSDPEGQAEVTIRMGWTDSPEKARARLSEYSSFADEVHKEDIGRILVLGMGGSSLTAEVLSSLLAASKIELSTCLSILDSTDPDQVAKAIKDFPPDQSLYIVASKSGGTAEVSAAFDTLWKISKGDGSRFIAITDANTSLAQLAREHNFRKVFEADATVGGRYSALTDFGMVPAALLGMDLNRLLERANWMKKQCSKDIPTARNPGMTLGAVLAESALAGRDKVTILSDTTFSALTGWIEQIIAESSGKEGKGMLPVVLEPLDMPEVYKGGRLFIYLRQSGELDNGIAVLRAAGHPVIEFPVSDPYDAGAEFLRWEIAVATACHILGVNAYDQPDVQDSKDRTKAKIAEFRSKGRLVEENSGFGPQDVRISEFLGKAQDGDYFAINAYLERNAEMVDNLQRMRVAIREKTKCAVTAGFGPRFQHSTGQYHKGGPNTGLFIQIITDPENDMEIPNEGMTFGTLIRAQALGDYETLVARGRRVIRIHLSKPSDIGLLVKSLQKLATE
jgi:transaldolase/glucose-6-phosphate isomerase